MVLQNTSTIFGRGFTKKPANLSIQKSGCQKLKKRNKTVLIALITIVQNVFIPFNPMQNVEIGFCFFSLYQTFAWIEFAQVFFFLMDVERFLQIVKNWQLHLL
jgi:hypothetical protein